MLPRSIQGRMLVLVPAAVAVVWAAALGLTWAGLNREVDALLDDHLTNAAALLVARGSGEPEDDADASLDELPATHYAPSVAFQVWHEGRLVLHSNNAPQEPLSPRIDGFETRTIAGLPWRIYGARGAEADIQVWVGEQIEARKAIVDSVLKSLLWPLAFALPLLAAALWFGVRAGLAPMRRLSSELAARPPLHEDPVMLDDAPAEMQPLVDELNGLLGRIGARVESERRFTADAAHELRTPIAAIRAQAQAALGASVDAERRRSLQATLAGCDRASHLVEQLLTLARLDAAHADPEAPAIDFAATARESIAVAAAGPLAREQDMEFVAAEGCRIRADATLVCVLIRNLVDNASRYSPRGASIRIAISRNSRECALTVDDSGPGMDEASIARLGERFFRVTGSAESGSGLGFSIVRRIAQVQGAKLEVRRSFGLGGMSVRVVWPLAPAEDQMQRPPSTSSATPVIIDASSLQR